MNKELEIKILDSYELPNRVLTEVPQPVISVRTSTYNHASYIKQCIDGVLRQKTTYAMEYIIGEDYSTDGTREIVFEYAKKYPNIIRVVTADYNVGMKANGQRCINRCRGKYMAICEGDDYWSDPYKLQKQVELLEQNEKATLAYTGFQTVDFVGNAISRPMYNYYASISSSGDVFYRLLRGNFILTLTTCFRRDILLSDEVQQAPTTIDYLLFLIAAAKGDAIYMPEKTSCYRQHCSSIMATAPKVVSNQTLDAFKYVAELYVKGAIRRRSMVNNLLINIFIMRRAIGLYIQNDRYLLRIILSIKKSMLVFVVPAVLEICFCKFITVLKRLYPHKLYA